MTAPQDETAKNYFSLFPEERIVSLLDAFVINQPMTGSVGGDGFWVHQTLQDLYIVVFDCMGHGHLASMMTRIYTKSLEYVMEVQKEEDPGKILSALHAQIKEKFEGKKNLQIGSGADVGVAKVDLMTRRIEYAGAKMELLMVENEELSTIKPARIQVGDHFEVEHQYETKVIEVQSPKKVNFYLSSDGFKDLFGGFEAKKLGKTKVKELLEKSYSHPMQKQKKFIGDFLNQWSGGFRPLDDVLIVGFSL